MNNSQFRDLVKTDKSKSPPNQDGPASSTFVPRSLGSRARSSVPMTPRAVTGYSSSKDFTRQVAEHTRQSNGEPPLKKFKSSAAPKGTKLAEGYQDRAKRREDTYNQETSRETKLKDLEKMLKDEKIDQATFDKLRDQMGIGGDLSTTHLVKGLDFKLLERMRRGDDINDNNNKDQTPDEEAEPPPEVDDELDNVLDKDIGARQQNKLEAESDEPKAQPQYMSREEILQRLKESRNARAAPAAVPEAALGERFKKVAAADKSGKKKFVESINGRRREVLLITKKDGTTKRKTRWIDPEDAANNENAMPLGMEVPAEFAAKQKLLDERQAAEDDNDDIFAGVADYDPLQDLDSNSEDEASGEVKEKLPDKKPETELAGRERNYFASKENTESKDVKFSSIKDDPNLMAALKRAAALRKTEQDGEQNQKADSTPADPEQAEKHQKFLARLKKEAREDDQDMDLGFGESRFGDEDDENGPIYDGEEEGGEGKPKRKRAPKKRKGDKDSVADVMGVLEGRKK